MSSDSGLANRSPEYKARVKRAIERLNAFSKEENESKEKKAHANNVATYQQMNANLFFPSNFTGHSQQEARQENRRLSQ